MVLLSVFAACDDTKEHIAPAIKDRDSVSMMTTYGANTLISDSGIMRYRIITERWEVNDVLSQPRWMFKRGLFLEEFDEKFNVEMFIQSDTAYYFTNKKLWHLWGNVHVKTTDGLIFDSQELYWDQERHELYSNLHSHVVTPEREIDGAYFTSDEQMRHYKVTNSKGTFRKADIFKDDKPSTQPAPANGSSTTPADSIQRRQASTPKKR